MWELAIGMNCRRYEFHQLGIRSTRPAGYRRYYFSGFPHAIAMDRPAGRRTAAGTMMRFDEFADFIDMAGLEQT